MHALAPQADAPPIVARAAGNPFFAEELAAAGRLGREQLPEDLADLLLVRADALPEAARRVVRAASAAGGVVSHEVLAEVVDADDRGDLDLALRAALDTHVLTAGDEGYAFRHALLAEAVHDDLLPGERRRLHTRYVQVLSGRTEVGAAAATARHARAAGLWQEAFEAAVRAGDEAAAAAGPADAAAFYETALTLQLQQPKSARAVSRAHLALRAAAASVAAGNPYRAAELLGEIDDRAEEPGMAAELVTARTRAQLLADTRTQDGERITQVLEQLGDEPGAARAGLLAVQAQLLFTRDDFAGATLAATEAARIGRDLELPHVVADATTTLARLDDFAGEAERSLTVLSEVIDQACASGDVDAELRARHQVHRVHSRAGRHRAALEVLLDSTARAERLGVARHTHAVDSRLLAAHHAVLTGQWPLADELLQLGDTPTAPLHRAMFEAIGMSLDAARGRDDAVLIAGDRARPMWAREMLTVVHGAAAVLDVHGRRGEWDAMWAMYEEIVDTVRRVWELESFDARIRLSGLVISHLADGRMRGDAAAAEYDERVEDAARVAQEVASTRHWESSLGLESRVWLGIVRTALDRFRWGGRGPVPDGLPAAVEQVLVLLDEAEMPYERLRVGVVAANLAMASGDVAQARADVTRLRAGARELGAAGVLRALPAGAEPVVADSSGTPALTAREHEVLLLVADGLSNGEIAARLFVTTKTVSVHVSNILAKFAAANRTEAAALARRAGLLREV